MLTPIKPSNVSWNFNKWNFNFWLVLNSGNPFRIIILFTVILLFMVLTVIGVIGMIFSGLIKLGCMYDSSDPVSIRKCRFLFLFFIVIYGNLFAV